MAVSTTLLETMAPAKATGTVEEIQPNKTNTVTNTVKAPSRHCFDEDTLIMMAIGFMSIINVVMFGLIIDLSVRNRVLMTHILPGKK